MDPYSLPFVAVVLDGLSRLVGVLADLVSPVAGDSAAALAVVAFTVLVRLVLTPVAVSQVRAEIARRRLAPQVAEVTRRHRDPAERGRALTELYAREGASPMAGCLPTLAQAPVLAAVYSLFAHPAAAGTVGGLLGGSLAGAPLDGGLVAAWSAGAAPGLVVTALLALLAVVVELTRRASLRAAGGAVPAEVPSVPGLTGVLRVVPFVTVVVAAVVPLAAGLYVVTSAVWTLGERALWRRVLGRREAGRGAGRARPA